ncbi:cupin domain-containing protein [Salinibaculum rarum]|uniref:cupin domain-containing protein n=1 Tax=Salinibaculum rarum TaxID=3058903 RepID=UPI00265EF9A9|nr:cupin domain-containing protein [Salinibaculum sp. KK48]
MIQTATLAEFDADGRTPVFEDPQTVHLGLKAGDSVPPHTHPGEWILFVVQEGAIELTVGEETATLSAGSVAQFDGDADIAVEAREDSRALVVLTDQ